jgi:hypothetical protein
MLAPEHPHTSTWREISDVMNSGTFRISIIGAIVLISALEVVVVLAIVQGELTDRSVSVLSVVLATLAPTVASLFVLLRVDHAAVKADVAAEKASTAAKKVDRVHHDMLNGGLRDNVKQAISEDRHEVRNREAARIGQQQMEERLRRRQQGGEDSP